MNPHAHEGHQILNLARLPFRHLSIVVEARVELAHLQEVPGSEPDVSTVSPLDHFVPTGDSETPASCM